MLMVHKTFIFQGEDEVMFLDFRKELKVLIDNIAILVMYTFCECVREILLSLYDMFYRIRHYCFK